MAVVVTRPRMSEADLQRFVLDAARMFGWRTFHARPSQTASGRHLTAVAGDGKGYPDLTMIHRGRALLLVAELKATTAPSRITPAQWEWLLDWQAVSDYSQRVQCVVWTPADHPDEVLRVLRDPWPIEGICGDFETMGDVCTRPPGHDGWHGTSGNDLDTMRGACLGD